MHSYLAHELQVLELRQKIASTARDEMSQGAARVPAAPAASRDPAGTGRKRRRQGRSGAASRALREGRICPKKRKRKFERELARLERLPAGAPDYHVTRTYLEFVLDLPWNKQTEDNLDIAHAREVLDDDHFGLKEVKERILEHLSVLKRNPDAKAPILCLVGPPGVGKTSLGQSIARALGRKFERFSLGGMHDEAELRGHRRTYIGAMAGRLLQAMRRAGAKNPVLMLDEVDKLGRDFRGDPAAALLEVLDPEQNKTFRDNYLDLAFDLVEGAVHHDGEHARHAFRSRCSTVWRSCGSRATAKKRKQQIARRYLIPRQLKADGLDGRSRSSSRTRA